LGTACIIEGNCIRNDRGQRLKGLPLLVRFRLNDDRGRGLGLGNRRSGHFGIGGLRKEGGRGVVDGYFALEGLLEVGRKRIGEGTGVLGPSERRVRGKEEVEGNGGGGGRWREVEGGGGRWREVEGGGSGLVVFERVELGLEAFDLLQLLPQLPVLRRRRRQRRALAVLRREVEDLLVGVVALHLLLDRMSEEVEREMEREVEGDGAHVEGVEGESALEEELLEALQALAVVAAP
jgi:hypothetical protein